MSRIVLLPSAYLPSLGGVEEMTRHLALALVEAGDEVEVWAQQDDRVGHETSEVLDGLIIRRFPFPLPSSSPRSLVPLARFGSATVVAMRRAIRDFRPDVLHVICFGPNGVYATLMARLTRVPLVVTLQGETMMDDHDAFETSSTLRTSLRIALRLADQVTACSQFTLDDAIRRFGLPAGRGQVIFNGVDASLPVPSSDNVLVAGRYVLALGRVVQKKGFDLLIRGFALIADRHPGVTLAIGGAGPAEEALRRLAASEGLERQVRFLGRLSRNEVATAMAGAELFVMPSRLEPFGIVVLEAWRAGLPTVVTSHGGAGEFVEDGTTGFVVDPFDAAALGDAIGRLLDDPSIGRSVGAAARRRVAAFDWALVAAEYRRRYGAVIDRD